jgi:hypothetical protein
LPDEWLLKASVWQWHGFCVAMRRNQLTMKRITTCIFALATTALSVQTVSADDRVEKTFDVDAFTEIYMKGPYEVHLRQSDECALTIIAREDYMERLEVDSERGLLSIELKGNKHKKTRSVEVYIRFKDLHRLEIEGAVDLSCSNQISTKNLKLEFEGAGNVELDVFADKIISEIAGVGNFEIEGEVNYHKVDFSGIGQYEASGLKSRNTLVESNGIGSVKVYASEKFKGEANGIGSIEYFGDPPDVDIDASGLGSVNPH